MSKNYKNVKLTAGMVLAGLAGTASVSATHSAVAHASTVVASDQSKTNNTQAGEQKDSQKTLTFTTANAENSSKSKNEGDTKGSLNYSQDTSTTLSINKTNEKNNNTSKPKQTMSPAIFRESKVQATSINASQAKATNVKTDLYPQADSVAHMGQKYNSQIPDREVSTIPSEFGMKGSFTVSKKDMKKGNKIFVGDVTFTNNLHKDSTQNNVTNPNVIFVNGSADAISSKYGKIGTITWEQTAGNKISTYFTPNNDKEFAEDVNVTFANNRAYSLGWMAPFSVYSGSSESNPFIETITTPNSSYTQKFIPHDVNELKSGWDHNPTVTVEGVNYVTWLGGILPFSGADKKTELTNIISTNGDSIKNETLKPLHRVYQVSGKSISPTEINNRLYLYAVDKDGKLTDDKIHVDDVTVKNMPKLVQMKDSLSVQDIYNQVPNNSIGYSKQSDGNYLVAYNINPQDYIYTKDQITNWVSNYSTLANITDPSDKQKIIDNTVDFYTNKMKGTPLEYKLGLKFKKSDPQAVDVVAKDVTPTDNIHTQSNGTFGQPEASSDGTLLSRINYTFVDDDNNGLVVGTPTTLTGKAGDVVNPHLSIPTGYVLADGQRLPGDYTLKDSNDPIIIHLKRVKKSASFTVKYVDQDTGKEIPNTEFTQTGVEGDAIKYSTADTIKKLQDQGYTLVNDGFTNKAGDKLTAQNNDKTYVVTLKKIKPQVKQGTQTFNFVDKKTGKIITTSKVGGDVGKDIPISLKVPDGYKLVEGQKVPTSASIKDKDNPINILVEKISKPSEVETPTPAPETPAHTGTPKPADNKGGDKKTQNCTQTFNFVDKATNKTVGTSKVGGEVGKDVAVSLKVPNGYKLVAGQKVPTSATIKDKDTPINILVEKDNNKKPAQQTYQFIDQNGNKVVGTAVVKGNEGDHVPVSLKVPKGYHLVPGQKLPTVADLKATDKPIKILVAKDGTDGNGNADSGINGKSGKPNKGNAGNNNAGNNGNGAGNNAGNGNGGNGVASLPQTGNSKSNAGILAGSALVATMASLGIAYNKKKRNA